MSKFKIGDRVADKIDRFEFDDCNEPREGTVIEGSAPGKIMVQWDQYSWEAAPRAPELVAVKNLLPPKEAKARFSELEKEYNGFVKEAETKLKAASKLIKEANKIAKKAGAESLSDFHEAYGPLYDAMDAAGWRTSSFGC
jgi:hypothetical protein